jgi:branched-chain amino acid transport system ATP-binding protein
MLLKVKEITVHYGKAIAVDSVSLEVAEGTVVTIIGGNGAGKSTILKALSGLTPLTSGEIWFLDKRIDGMAPFNIVHLGLVHIPEGRRLFPYLTVLSNLKLGSSLRKDKAGIKKDMDEVFEHFPILWERRNQKAGTLSGGEQQMLAIARSLMAKPKLLLMDEPSLGLAPKLVDELVPIIKNINQSGVGVLLVEQNVPLALRVAERAYALQVGKITKAEIEPDIIRQFIGGKGFAAKVLYDELKPGTNPLSPDNILVMVTGPLAGTNAPAFSKTAFATKSPLTGIFVDSYVGGNLGPEMRFAGYELVTVRGKAKKPVCVYINDEEVKIEDASDLWGKDVVETEEALKGRFGRDARIASIGPAGENLISYACVCHEIYRQLGRGGNRGGNGLKKLESNCSQGNWQS